MHPYLITVVIAVVGSGLAVQAATNARLGAILQVPLASAFWNFVLGSVALGLLLASGVFGRPTLAHASAAPWWVWIGGLFGALDVTTMTAMAVPRVGTVAMFGAIICGQFIGAVLIDTNGWLGVEPIPLSATRVLGVRLLVAGVFLVQQR
ncbi:MAG: DMT family transporter [Halofilum sp. (in: g-proteobacteria)]|nr:DMT family transporter [Halofilum sp. (in: g-proteobacteria)]